jgi:putative DNA methylase
VKTYPRRLIEVDLPIKAISAHARREKSIRHGHISTLHIWWARRPLAACRAVLCAALWPDPADEACPPAFRQAAALALANFAEQVRSDSQLAGLCKEHWTRWVRTTLTSLRPDDPAAWADMRYALLDFIADFANWDASSVPAFLETARLLTHTAHLALSGQVSAFSFQPSAVSDLASQIKNLKSDIENAPRPLVVDPFAGGGSIPLEALRIGADAFASDLNPVAVLLNKVVLEYIPKYGNYEFGMMNDEGQEVVLHGLAEAVRYWGNWIKGQAEVELAAFYPKDPDGATPIAYLWARTITCEGPGCGAKIPLIRNLQLTRKGTKWCIALKPRSKHIEITVIEGIAKDLPTARSGSATCPCCGYTTPAKSVRAQLSQKRGGSREPRLFAVYVERDGLRYFRNPTEADLLAFDLACNASDDNLLPKEKINPVRPYKNSRGVSAITRIGIIEFGDLYNPRQALLLFCLQDLVLNINLSDRDSDFNCALVTLLHFIVSRYIFQNCSLSRWNATGAKIEGAFGKQALQVVWDFAEANPFSNGSANWGNALEWVAEIIGANSNPPGSSTVVLAPAQSQILPDEIAHAFVTDPPYFAAIPYADLSNVFYVWERKLIEKFYPDLYVKELVNQQDEIIVTNANLGAGGQIKSPQYFQQEMAKAFSSARVSLLPDGIGVIVFADSTTQSWEAILGSIIDAGWIVTSSWPIDTELQNRTQAQGSASLQSSIHIVCRPREDIDGKLLTKVGDWRDVLAELPERIHAWLPRLAQEGVVGADAIFACLGPALEIFSRYSRVEKASGEQVTLKEYLEVVWAEVARQALGMIFEGADASGFEEDARLTAMWLWTLNSGQRLAISDQRSAASQGEMLEEEVDEETEVEKGAAGGYILEYDAARKIAQGLGAHLERLEALVEVKGDKARLFSVSERAHTLFGKQEDVLLGKRKKKGTGQLSLFNVLDEAEAGQSGWSEAFTSPAGATSLDQLHQTMLLFASGRGEALKRFLVEDGVGKDQRIWRLAQALSALYPAGSEEKRWVDGVLARKKGLGF